MVIPDPRREVPVEPHSHLKIIKNFDNIYIVKGGMKTLDGPVYIDGEKLRQDLMDYFGTSTLPFKMVAVARVESATPEEVISLAEDEGFDLDSYRI